MPAETASFAKEPMQVQVSAQELEGYLLPATHVLPNLLVMPLPLLLQLKPKQIAVSLKILAVLAHMDALRLISRNQELPLRRRQLEQLEVLTMLLAVLPKPLVPPPRPLALPQLMSPPRQNPPHCAPGTRALLMRPPVAPLDKLVPEISLAQLDIRPRLHQLQLNVPEQHAGLTQ